MKTFSVPTMTTDEKELVFGGMVDRSTIRWGGGVLVKKGE
jgi:hypothetical protein